MPEGSGIKCFDHRESATNSPVVVLERNEYYAQFVCRILIENPANHLYVAKKVSTLVDIFERIRENVVKADGSDFLERPKIYKMTAAEDGITRCVETLMPCRGNRGNVLM